LFRLFLTNTNLVVKPFFRENIRVTHQKPEKSPPLTANPPGDSLVRAAMSQLNLSARGYRRVLKLARTIADLARSEGIQAVHLAEALQYRPKLMLG